MVKAKRKFGGKKYSFCGYVSKKPKKEKGVRTVKLTPRQRAMLKRMGRKARYVRYSK